MKKILVVDDEPSLLLLIEFNLRLAGYEVRSVQDGESVFDELHVYRPDLIVLDLMLPKMDGYEVCKKLRSQNDLVPVIILSALQDLSDKIAGLDNGADDYLTKPFSPQELIARINAIFRRIDTLPQASGTVLDLDILQIKPDQREVRLNGKLIELTPKEFDLLLFLGKNEGKVLSRQQLLHGVWDYHFIGDTRIVDVHISHLRDKIEMNPKHPEYITTIRNIGYKLSIPTPDEKRMKA